MNLIRRAILALALAAGIAPAFAQAPPPVPALPDTERRTSYSISGTICTCAVNMALYGDSTDYQNWVEVFLNGVRVNFNDVTFGWTITSPTGPFSTIPRPITDAVLTFNSVQTGTVQIVGARRPRRVSQFTENRGVAARDLNQALTDIVAQNRESWDKTNDITGRAVLGRPGETLALLPVLASRQNMGACFDSGGNLTSCLSIPSTSFVAGNGISLTGVSPTTIAINIAAGSGIALSGTNPITISGLPVSAGGRLTIVAGQPIGGVASNATALYFAPLVSPYVPIYDGTSIKNFNFTSSAIDTFGLTLTLGSNWPANTVHDVFATLVGGVPTLCTVAWTNNTTRLLSLTAAGALFNGILTNFTAVTCRTTNAATINMLANQGTYLGTILTDATNAGQITNILGGGASGGVQGRLAVWNYYNRRDVVGATIDTGARYAYSSLTWRVARASPGMQIFFVQGLPQDPITLYAFDNIATTATSGAAGGTGFGIDTGSTPTVGPVCSVVAPTANIFSGDCQVLTTLSGGAISPGAHFIAVIQQSDGTNALNFDNTQQSLLQVRLPM